jgi:selenide,water dikinase
MVEWDAGISAVDRLLLADAQTSGGLLISVPTSRLDKLVRELEKERVETIAVIGEIEAAPPGRIKVTP